MPCMYVSLRLSCGICLGTFVFVKCLYSAHNLICTHMRAYVRRWAMYVRTYVLTLSTSVFAYLCAYLYHIVRMYVHTVCTYVCMYACVYIHISMCTYVRTYEPVY